MGTGTPPIRTFQNDPGSLAALARSINVYRGQAVIPLPLIGLPGRNGLNVAVTALYAGTSLAEVLTWNMSAPTGILGLGWDLPLDQIVATISDYSSPSTTSYALSVGGNMLALLSTGVDNQYQTQDYQFWQVTYNPADQAWTVVRDNGDMYTYGGPDAGANSYLEYGVRWATWLGGSTAPGGARFPIAWNLRSIRNAWGDEIAFTYAYDVVPIGANGPTFTRASRLLSITDVYQRTLTFTYLPKTTTAEMQEIQPAHVAPDNGQIQAFQDHYQPQYLTGIDVADAAGEPLLTVAIASSLQCFADPPSPGLYKRCIDDLSLVYPGCAPLPGPQFSYNQASAVAPGSLQAVQYAQGGSATFTYGVVGLQNAAAVTAIASHLGTPRVWFGPDYVVVTFQDDASLTVDVYSWLGGWSRPWEAQVSAAGAQTDLRVQPQDDFFVLYYQGMTSPGAVNAYVFMQNQFQSDQWTQQELGATVASLVVGRNCVLTQPVGVAQLDLYAVQSGSLLGPRSFGLPSSQVVFTGSGNAFPVLSYTITGHTDGDAADSIPIGNGTVGMLAQDATGDWVYNSSVQTINGILCPSWLSETFWSPAATFAAATYIMSDEQHYEVAVLSWAQAPSAPDWQVLDTLLVPTSGNLPFAQSVAIANVIGNCQYLWRYDGDQWQAQMLSSIPQPPPNAQTPVASFAYGDDIAIMGTLDGSATTYQAATYDPYYLAWNAPTALGTAPAGPNGPYPATIGLDFMTIGTAVYFRGADSSWQPIRPGQIGPSVDLATVKNVGPEFILAQDTMATTSYLVVLNNGACVAQQGQSYLELSNQCCYVPNTAGELPGTVLVGPQAFITYGAGESFDQGAGLTLYRVMDAQFDIAQAYQTATVVTGLSISDGVTTYPTAYDYNEVASGSGAPPVAQGATYDQNSRIPQFTKVTIREGVASGSAETPYGWRVQYFINGVTPTAQGVYYPYDDDFTNVASYYSLLNGMLLYEHVYDATAQLCSSRVNWWFATVVPVGPGMASYVRQTRSVQLPYTIPLPSVSIAVGDIEQLNGQTVPSSIRSMLAAQGLDLSTGSTACYVLPIERSAIWLILDEANDRAFQVMAPSGQHTFAVMTGARRTTAITTNAANGQPAKQTMTNCDASGVLEYVATTFTYLCDVQPSLSAAHNLLSPIVQQSQQHQPLDGSTDPQYFASSVTLWWSWSQAGDGTWIPDTSFDAQAAQFAPVAMYTWLGPSASTPYESPDFGAWQNNAPDPASWQVQSQLRLRSPHGLVTECVTGDGVPTSYLYGPSEGDPLAQFCNASLTGGEASYFGFDPNESNLGWQTMPGEGQPVATTTEAHTGEQCYVLPASGAQSLTYRFAPNRRMRYLFSCWVKTADGFLSTDSAGWSFTALDGGQPVAPPLPISSTDNHWQFLCRLIDLSAAPSDLAVLISATNQAVSAGVYLDNLCLAPVPGTCSARAIDQHTGVVTATITHNGPTIFSVYTSDQQAVAEAGPADHYTLTTRSRLCGAGAASMRTLIARARQGGSYTSFTANNWIQPVSATSSADWNVTNHWLRYSGTGAATLTFVDSAALSDFALRFEVQPPATLSGPLTLSIGETIDLQLDTSAGQQMWTLVDHSGAPAPQPAVNPLLGNAEWCVVVRDTLLLFCVGGMPVFSHEAARPLSGPVALAVTQSSTAIKDLLLLVAPLEGCVFSNGAGQLTQSHILADGVSIVRERLYDQLGRPAVSTKPAPVQSVAGAYVAGFASMDWEAGTMEGTVAAYYPADEKYPFTRTMFAPNPIGQIVEASWPGAPWAITGQTTDHTTTLTYGVNLVGDFTTDPQLLHLPPAHYPLFTYTDPDGVTRYTVTDKLGTVIAQAVQNGTDGLCLTANRYDCAGALLSYFAPNAYTPPPNQPGTTFVSTYSYDPLSALVSAQTPDGGQVNYIHDPAGRLRFKQDPAGQRQGYFNYWTYDELGRVLETGVISGSWEPGTLATYAQNFPGVSGTPDWPSAGVVGRAWYKQFAYDGDGSQPGSIGAVTQITTNNDNGTVVTETYTYDAIGRLVAITMQGSGSSQTTSFTYDSLDNVISLSDSSGMSVWYSYNALNQMIAVGQSASDTTHYAAYAYNPDGSVAQEILNAHGASVTLAFSYNSPGWLTGIGDGTSLFGETLYYNTRLDGSAGYFNGRVASRCTTFAWPGAPAGFTWDYHYDSLGQLQAASCSIPEWNVGVIAPLQYDADGNITASSNGVSASTYQYSANRVQSVRTGTTPEVTTFGYDPNGALNASSDNSLALTYSRHNGLPAALAVGEDASTNVSLTYGGADRRISKVVTDGTSTIQTAYSYGLDSHVLRQTMTTSAEQPAASASYVYGAGGLIAVDADQSYFTICDHLGSVRVVVDSNANVIAGYDYLPFGQMARSYGRPPSVLPYLYTGQEWDAEVGLYNYQARLYDPNLQRYYGLDPANQFASPYLYAANNPISFIDPTGALSVWGWVSRVTALATDAAEVVIGAVVDVILDVLSLGTLAPLAQTIGGTFIGAGLQSAGYVIGNWKTFSWEKYGIQMGIGAAVGLVTGGFGDVASFASGAAEGAFAAGSTAARAASIATKMAINGVGGIIGAGGGQMLSNAATTVRWNTNLWRASLMGLGSSVGSGIVSTGAELGMVRGIFHPALEYSETGYNYTYGKALLARAVVGALSGAALGGGIQIAGNCWAHQSWDHNLAFSAGTGALIGSLGVLGPLRKAALQAEQIRQQVSDEFMARGSSRAYEMEQYNLSKRSAFRP